MAAAEARAAWQRTANRCFVQEDAKRAPKLACCQSSSSSSKQHDTSTANSLDEFIRDANVFSPFTGIPSRCSLSPDTRWWLLMQPNFEFQKGLSDYQFTSSEAKSETLRSPEFSSMTYSQEKIGNKASNSNASSEICGRTNIQEVNVIKDHILPRTNLSKNLPDSMKKTDCGGYGDSKQFVDTSSGSSGFLSELEKTGPWWHSADRDELTSFVRQKSHGCVENCDLPPPQKGHSIKTNHFVQFGNYEPDRSGVTYLNPKTQSSNSGHNCSLKIGGVDGQQESMHEFMKPLRKATNSDMSKNELLEALCHSQTRAREAETEVKKAKAEKEDLMKLFFNQASHLFAYKQWFRLLQLETLQLRLENADKLTPCSPITVSLVSSDAWNIRKRWLKSSGNRRRNKKSQHKHGFTKYTVVFALGLSLIGAGLFLGWTVGWLLLTF